MALFDKDIEAITETDLFSLIENEVREGYQIEYKQSVALKEKQDKLDFLASLTSFANTIGGDLLIGVKAESGLPRSIPGWQDIDPDQEQLRIENLLRDQVEPRISVAVREIRLSSGGAVILLRVPWSWAQPHMVRMDQVNRFYYRHSAGKDIMNVTQLRGAFALTTRLDEQIARFRQDRTNKIKTGAGVHLTPPPGPTVILHLIPFESFRSGFNIDLEAAISKAGGSLLPLGGGSNWAGFNLDGVYSTDNATPCDAYSQIFRNGITESANRTILIPWTDRKLIPCGSIVRNVLTYVQSCLAFYRSIAMSPPVGAALTIVNVGEYEFAKDAEGYGSAYFPTRVDRGDLEFPASVIENLNQSPADICRPMFDAFFNAAGSPRWSEYENWRREFQKAP